jgi:hypothetical protein
LIINPASRQIPNRYWIPGIVVVLLIIAGIGFSSDYNPTEKFSGTWSQLNGLDVHDLTIGADGNGTLTIDRLNYATDGTPLDRTHLLSAQLKFYPQADDNNLIRAEFDSIGYSPDFDLTGSRQINRGESMMLRLDGDHVLHVVHLPDGVGLKGPIGFPGLGRYCIQGGLAATIVGACTV